MVFGWEDVLAEKFQVDLRGVVDLLSQHLYSSPEVFVRELLQNGVDATTARKAIDPGHVGAIRLELVETASGPPTIIAEDDGVGLTEEEVHRFLSTIGASSKREDLQARREDFIGQFGIGILSCFMVCDEIVLISRSARDAGSVAVEWRGRADGTYTVRRLERALSPGTRVCLRCKSGAEEFFGFRRLRDLAGRYGDMLPIPITLVCGKRSETINRSGRPWELAANPGDAEALTEYARSALGIEPLDTVSLTDEALGVSGVAFVLPTPQSPGAGGPHRIYLKGMFIGEKSEGLLPEWAFFVRCAVNARALRPTASREGFYQDRALERVCEEIGRRLRDHLMQLARRDRSRLEQILMVHDLAFRSLAIDDDEFFDLIIDLLPFETSLGRVTLGVYRREHDSIRVAPTGQQFRQVAPIAAAQSISVFNGGYTYHTELLEKAASRLPGLAFEVVSATDLMEAFEELTEAEEDRVFEFLRAADEALGRFNCAAEVRRFRPVSVPALYGADLDASFFRSIEKTKEIADEHWGDMLSGVQGAMGQTPKVQLCFNFSNPLVQRLIGLADPGLRRNLVEVLYVQSLLLGQHPLSSKELGVLNSGLGQLIERALGKEGPE